MTERDDIQSRTEAAVLGAMLDGRNATHLARVAEILPAPLHRWFTGRNHRLVACGIDAAAAIGPVNSTTVMERLAAIPFAAAMDALRDGGPVLASGCADFEASALAAAGGFAGVSDLAGAGSFADVVANASQLRHAASRRQALEALRKAARAVERLTAQDGPCEALAGIASELEELARAAAPRDLDVPAVIRAAERAGRLAHDERQAGVPTEASWGIPALDALVPMRRGGLYILAGSPGGGKTSLALQAAHATARRLEQSHMAIASLEMTSEELGSILCAREMKLPTQRVLDGHLDDAQRARMAEIAAEWEAGGNAWIRDAATDRPTCDAVLSWLKQRNALAKNGLALGIIDHLGLMEHANPKATEYQRISDHTRMLKNAAVNLRAPLLVLSQMNREGRKGLRDKSGRISANPEPRMEDLRGSGSIEQDANAVVFLHREDPNDGSPTVRVRAIVAKHRNGATGSADLVFYRRYQHFEQARGSPAPDEGQRMRESAGVAADWVS